MGEQIDFAGVIAHKEYMLALREFARWERAGVAELRLNFSRVTAAFSDGMIGLVTTVDHLRRRRDARVTVELPESNEIRRLFLNAGWAHLLAPDAFPAPKKVFLNHLPAFRFESYAGQNEALNRLLYAIFRSVRLHHELQEALEWSAAELTDNVLTHAECPSGGIMHATAYERSIQFSVADSGVGVLSSMQRAHPEIVSDQVAVTTAIEEGVSGKPTENQGNGLAGSLKLAVDSHGAFGITSGGGNYYSDCRDSEIVEFSETHSHRDEYHQGTIVTVRIGDAAAFVARDTLARVTGRSAPSFMFLEDRFGTASPRVRRVAVAELELQSWSRASGKEARTLVENLLQQSPDVVVEVDWHDVTGVASSFVDEFVGKLLRTMGKLAFLERVRLVRLEGTPRVLVERALARRSMVTP